MGDSPSQSDNQNDRDTKGRFAKGHSGNPKGRKPNLAGLKEARMLINEILSNTANMNKVRRALKDEFKKDPLAFVTKYCDLTQLTRDMTRPEGGITAEIEGAEVPRTIAIHVAAKVAGENIDED